MSRAPHQGLCPSPFLQENTFPETGGFIPGRFCQPIPQLLNLTCCLPCPLTEFAYPDGFESRTEIANWVNVVALVASVFLLLSFAILDVKWTHRHYLSVCLTVSVLCIEIAFLLPLAGKPEQCFNEITPNDMKSSGMCAASGAFLLFGGWGAVIWVFLRALSLHLQICWEMVPGNRFFLSSLVFGWGVPTVGLAIALSLTGVSFRFGDVCHINHKLALQDFWGPLLAFAAIGMVLQFITLGYCIHVYIKSLMDDKSNTTNTSSNMQSYSGSVTTRTARQTFRRVKRVVELQWRGACIVLLIIGEVAFFSVVFVSMDNSFQLSEELIKKATPWLTCLATPGRTKDDCIPLVSSLAQSEGVVLAVLICLGMSGIWCMTFFGRWSMVLGWKDLFQRKMLRKNEFVSADVHRNNDNRTYEMLGGTAQPLSLNPPDRTYKSPVSPDPSAWSPNETDKAYYGGIRTYVTPATSYSVPRPPSSGQNRDWDPRMTWAKSHPPAPPSSYPRGKDFGG